MEEAPMRRFLAGLTLVLAIIPGPLAFAQPSTQARPAFQQSGTSACGPDAPDGLILHQAFAPDGSLADPPLALFNPTTNKGRPVDVPDPREWFPMQYGCNAIVKTAAGAYYVVFGSTGESFLLDFMKPEDEWKLDETAYWGTDGERRFGLFKTPGISGTQIILFDFEQGFYWDLSPVITADGSFYGADFSQSGDYLVLDGGPMMEPRTWLLPTNDPSKGRQLAVPTGSNFLDFDASEERMLYWSVGAGEGEQLIVEKIDSGDWYLVATDPSEKDEYDPYLSGWFVPGHEDLIAVLHADRFALVDISGPDPVEQFVIEGHRPFSTFAVAPSGRYGILDRKPATIFVDLETGEWREITTEDGTAINSVAPYGRWGIAVIGMVDEPPRGIGVVDLETGKFRTITMFGEGEKDDYAGTAWSRDGAVGLVTIVDANQKRHLSLVDNERGTTTPLADADTISVSISPDGAWAVYGTTTQGDAGPVHEMTLLETATGTTTALGPGLTPVWLWP
jgi:hypothetical protein